MTYSGFFSLGSSLSSLIRPTAIFHIVDGPPCPRGYRATVVNVPVVRLVCQAAARELFLFSVLETMLYFIVRRRRQSKPIWIR